MKHNIARTSLLIVAAIAVSAAAVKASAQTPTVSTFAGGGPNNIAALSAGLAFSAGVAVDNAGNVYIADADENHVYRVDSSGVLTIFAGDGASGYGGDGGPATSAHLFGPIGLAIASSGDLFVGDSANNVVRKVDTAGNITTVAGNGTPGFSGDGGSALSATLHSPTGLTVDSSGNLFIVDLGNQRIRKVTVGGIISTVAGNGASGYNGDNIPAVLAALQVLAGVAVDGSGNLFIADFGNNRIRKVDATGTISTVAGNGTAGFLGFNIPATSAELNSPSGVAVDSSGDVLIADTFNRVVGKVDTSGYLRYVAGNGPPGLSSPFDMALDRAGNLFITSAWPHAMYGDWKQIVDPYSTLFPVYNGDQQLRVADSSGNVTIVAGNGWGLTNFTGFPWSSWGGDGSPAAGAELSGPVGVSADNSMNIFITDGSRIRKVGTNGIISTFAGDGASGFSGDGGPAVNAELWDAVATASDTSGNLYIADYYNHRIRKVDTSGTITTFLGNKGELAGPTGLATDNAGNVFVADRDSNRIFKVTSTGAVTIVAGTGTAGYSGDGGPATSAQLNNPYEVSVDNSGNLYITDALNEVVRKVDTSGVITTIAGNGNQCPMSTSPCGDGGPASGAEFAYLGGIAVDSSGNLFLGDIFDDRVREINASSGIITTVAGNGYGGFGGDGGPPTSAQVNQPTGVALDSFGRLLIADQVNDRIRMVSSPSDFSINPASAALTLQPGAQGTDVITFSPLNAPFTSAIQLSCAVAGPTPMPGCSLSPTSVTPGASPATSTMTVTASSLSATAVPKSLHFRLVPWQCAMWLGLLFGGVLLRESSKQACRSLAACVILLLPVLVLAACGGSSNTVQPTPKNYKVTVTATSGAITHTTLVGVTVQ